MDEKIIKKLIINKFKGIDPYDFHEIKFRFPLYNKLSSKFSFINKVSPINFRPILGIRQTYNTKSNGLFLWAMVNSSNSTYDKEIKYLLNWFRENRASEFNEFSLGFAFNMSLSRYDSEPGKTSLIITLFVVFPIIELFKKTDNKGLLEIIFSFEKLLEEKWLKFNSKEELWYSYLPKQKDEVYNASAEVGKFYALLYSINPIEKYKINIYKIQNYLFKNQNSDGSWFYSKKDKYVDNFHTAFILDSLFEMNKIVNNPNGIIGFNKGLKDFISNCFIESKPLHFHKFHKPKDIRRFILETEIRDSANAVALFSKIGYLKLAKKVLIWTDNHLLDEKRNYYYFYSNKLYTCKINYVRWQAWMMYAKSEFNIYSNEEI